MNDTTDKMNDFKKLLIDTYEKYTNDYDNVTNGADKINAHIPNTYPPRRILVQYDNIGNLILKYFKNGFFGEKIDTSNYYNMTNEQKLAIMKKEQNVTPDNIAIKDIESDENDIKKIKDDIRNIINDGGLSDNNIYKNLSLIYPKESNIDTQNNSYFQTVEQKGGKKRRTKRSKATTSKRTRAKKCAKKAVKKSTKKMRS